MTTEEKLLRAVTLAADAVKRGVSEETATRCISEAIDLGIDVAARALDDLHRIADALEKIAANTDRSPPRIDIRGVGIGGGV
jgi:hypothetical protein